MLNENDYYYYYYSDIVHHINYRFVFRTFHFGGEFDTLECLLFDPWRSVLLSLKMCYFHDYDWLMLTEILERIFYLTLILCEFVLDRYKMQIIVIDFEVE